jgi:hypothetical protein
MLVQIDLLVCTFPVHVVPPTSPLSLFPPPSLLPVSFSRFGRIESAALALAFDCVCGVNGTFEWQSCVSIVADCVTVERLKPNSGADCFLLWTDSGGGFVRKGTNGGLGVRDSRSVG